MNQISFTKCSLVLLLLSFCMGCATQGVPPLPRTTAVQPEGKRKVKPAVQAEEEAEKSDQELLDSALEFCQAAYDYRDKGDIDNAVDALDQAYSLILQISPDADTEILQQRDDLRITISRRIVECYSSRFTVANGFSKAIPLTMNKYVESALEQLKGPEKSFFMDAYRRSGRYRPPIVKALKQAGLPEELSWLPLIESGFKVRALSRARALGLWQFIASTGYKYGLKRDQWVDERMDPAKATEAAIGYLKELHQIFGDWSTVLAAYNCGEGRVLRCIQAQRINYLDNFWDLYERLPSETAFYVPKFLAVLHILNNPQAHGFTLPEVEEEIATEAVVIDRQLEVRTIAATLDLPSGVLEDLNPSLRRQSTPNRPFSFRVPEGMGALLVAKVDEMPVWSAPTRRRVAQNVHGVQKTEYRYHKVRRGDSLYRVARRYGSSVRELMAINNLHRRTRLSIGMSLKVPLDERYASCPAGAPEPQSTYQVRRGDSLWKIAQQFGTTVEAIQTLNGLRDQQISVGQVLHIRGVSTGVAKAETETYTVRRGDSPFQIAQKHQMDLSELLSLNNLTPRSTIFPGQVLLVKAD